MKATAAPLGPGDALNLSVTGVDMRDQPAGRPLTDVTGTFSGLAANLTAIVWSAVMLANA